MLLFRDPTPAVSHFPAFYVASVKRNRRKENAGFTIRLLLAPTDSLARFFSPTRRTKLGKGGWY